MIIIPKDSTVVFTILLNELMNGISETTVAKKKDQHMKIIAGIRKKGSAFNLFFSLTLLKPKYNNTNERFTATVNAVIGELYKIQTCGLNNNERGNQIKTVRLKLYKAPIITTI